MTTDSIAFTDVYDTDDMAQRIRKASIIKYLSGTTTPAGDDNKFTAAQVAAMDATAQAAIDDIAADADTYKATLDGLMEDVRWTDFDGDTFSEDKTTGDTLLAAKAALKAHLDTKFS